MQQEFALYAASGMSAIAQDARTQVREVVAPIASTAAIPMGTPSGPGMPDTPTEPISAWPLNIGNPPVSITHGVESSPVRAVPSETLTAFSRLDVSTSKRAAVCAFSIDSSPECPSALRRLQLSLRLRRPIWKK